MCCDDRLERQGIRDLWQASYMAPMTMAEKLDMLRERYWLSIGPLLLLIAVGLNTSPHLFWVAMGLLLALTLNKVVPLFK